MDRGRRHRRRQLDHLAIRAFALACGMFVVSLFAKATPLRDLQSLLQLPVGLAIGGASSGPTRRVSPAW